MLIALYLVLLHFLGDFVCQSDWMAINKSKRWDALTAHVAIYTAIILLGTGFNLSFALITFGAHFATDAVTSRISRAWFPFVQLPGRAASGKALYVDYEGVGLRSRHNFFTMIGFDQVLHYAQLFLTAYWLLGVK